MRSFTTIVTLLIVFLLLLSACKKEESFPIEFVEFQWEQNTNSPNRLCAPDITSVDELIIKTHPDCVLEGDDFSTGAAPKNNITIMAYNILRGERDFEGLIETLKDNPEVEIPDIILLSEVDRNCGGNTDLSQARVMAEELGMYYIFGSEFSHLDGCEIGNAILSKYPMGNAKLLRFESNVESSGTRFGARMSLVADIKIGNKALKVHSTHLASDFFDEAIRIEQTQEMLDDVASLDYPVVLGGDLNTNLYIFDQNTAAYSMITNAGYTDLHDELSTSDRVTHVYEGIDLILDFIFARNCTAVQGKVGSEEIWDSYSDHLPVWGEIEL